MKKIINLVSAITLVVAFCFSLSLQTPQTQAEDGGSVRDVIPPTTYITEDQAHARLFTYNDSDFTNISAANQDISPEVNAITWNNTDGYWAIVARGRLWIYDSTVHEILGTNPYDTPEGNIYPYVDIASNGSHGLLAGALTGRGMSYDGTSVSSYNLANTKLTSDVSASTTTFPVQDGTKFQADDIIQVGMENCLVETVVGNNLTVTRGYANSETALHGTGEDVSIAIADIVSVDWDTSNSRWIVAALAPDNSTHLYVTSANNSSTDLGLTGVTKARGDYRVGDTSYYLVGGENNNSTASKLYSYDNSSTLTDITGQIPNMSEGVRVITGGTSDWMIGGEGTNILYRISETEGSFSGSYIGVPTALTSVTAIGYQGDNKWLIGGKDSEGNALLYSYNYNTETFVDLTTKMQTDTQAAITTINSIVWNGSIWLIGGAGLFNVGPENGGSVMSTDENAKVAFTGGSVEHDSSVRVSVTTDTITDNSLKSASAAYDFTAQDLVANESVTQFSKSATISLSYNPTTLGDIPESNLSVYYYNETTKQWVQVSGTVDTSNNVITAEVDHFTKFGVFASNSLPYTGK